MTDLILCAAIVNPKQEDNLEQVIKKLDKHKFHNKYILFDGTVEQGKFETRYTKYKNYIKINYPDFTVIENQECLYHRKTLERFVKDNFEALSKNCFVLQDDILIDDFDLDKVLKTKAVFDECKILYFREHRLRCKLWFNIIDDSGELIKTHDWNEKAYLITKDWLIKLLDKDKVKYYEEMIKDKCWETITKEEQLEYWQKWGSYEHKTIRHKHLETKRS